MPKYKSLITTLVLMSSGLTLGDPSAPAGYSTLSYDNGANTQQQTPDQAAPKAPDTAVSQFFGGTLETLSADGTLVPADREKVKKIQYFLLFYSASIYPVCAQFTPKLLELYNSCKAANPNFEVILVPGDQSEEDVASYMQSNRMPWLTVEFSHSDDVIQKFGFHSFPSVIFMDSTGRIISSNLTPEMQHYPLHVLKTVQATLN